MNLSNMEIFLINRYAAAELAGAIYLGKWSRVVKDRYLRHKLAWHCYEEARHAKVWYDLIDELKIPSLEVHDESGAEFFSPERDGEIKDIIEFLAATHIHELRVPFHFTFHSKFTTDERVKKVLLDLAKEEGPHLAWIRAFLRKEYEGGNENVLIYLNKYLKLSMDEYREDIKKLLSKWPESNHFLDDLEKDLIAQEQVMKKAISF